MIKLLYLILLSSLYSKHLPTQVNFSIYDPENLLGEKFDLFVNNLTNSVEDRTSIILNNHPPKNISEKVLKENPILIYLTCFGFKNNLEKNISEDQIKSYIEAGGTILISECSAFNDSYDQASKFFSKIFSKENKFTYLSYEQAFFKAFNLISQNFGCKEKDTFVSGLELEGRVAVFYFKNNLHDLIIQNCSNKNSNYEMAMRTFINFFIYVLTSDYKLDQISSKQFLNSRM